MSLRTCPVCGKESLSDRVGVFETPYTDRKGVERVLKVPNIRRLYCRSCNEEIFDDAVTKQIEEARRNAMGLLSAAQIREIRTQLGKTQKEMSRLLGVGEKTYCRWESGSFLQSQSFDNYLRLVRDIPEAWQMLLEIEQYGVNAAHAQEPGTEPDFEFLANAGELSEQAARFTEQLVYGTLQIATG
jgi:putative zinc finger/helix-turn-helix YgiT family protein